MCALDVAAASVSQGGDGGGDGEAGDDGGRMQLARLGQGGGDGGGGGGYVLDPLLPKLSALRLGVQTAVATSRVCGVVKDPR